MQMSIRLDRLKRFVCLLLIFVLLFCFFMCPRASAVALEATTIAYGGLLVGTILVGAGVVFSSHGDMVKVGNAMYKTLVNGSNAIGKTISSISAWAVEHGTSLAKGALRVGKDMYQSIVDAFNASYSDGRFSISSPSVSDVYASYPLNSTMEANISSFFAAKPSEFYWSWQDSKSSSRHWKAVIAGDYAYWYSGAPGGDFKVVDRFLLSTSYKWQNIYFALDGFGSNVLTVQLLGDYYDTDGDLCTRTFASNYGVNYPVYLSTSDFYFKSDAAIAIPPSDLVYPSDNYLVKMPDIPSVDTATGEVTYPDNIAYTKDAVAAPYPIGDDGVKVPDIPFDIPVDQTSGKPLDDTGTDTDTPSKPGEGTDTVDWPTSSDLSLPKLIITKFPFCIPFDIANMIGLLEAEPKAPVFKMPLKIGTVVNEEITLDLDQFSDVIRIIRWGELILFVAGLALVTRNYIKW